MRLSQDPSALKTKRSDMNERENSDLGYTPLIWASEKGKLDVVKFLVEECHVDIMKMDLKWRSCLMRAIQANQLEIVKYLSEKGQLTNLKMNARVYFMRN